MIDLLPLLGTEFLSKPLWMWLSFVAIIICLMSFDLGILHKKNKDIGVKESLYLSAFYIIIGLLYGGWIWHKLGADSGADYLTGFVVEKSLAMDNLFVIAMIFGYFAIPREYQHRVLFWGILGVIVLRGIMIGGGAVLIHEFEWILYVFSAFLIFSGIKMMFMDDKDEDIGESKILKYIKSHFRITDKLHGNKFTVKLPDATGKIVTYFTPLAAALVMIELADVIFAVDSIPAIFSITTDPYIVYTSNVFAILGLRALFFALSALMERFAYLKYALSLILVFIGSKIFLNDFMGIQKFPPAISLGVTLALLAGGVIYSLWKTRDVAAVKK